MKIEDLIKQVNLAIRQLGVNPEEARNKETNQWDLLTGKLHLMIDVFEVGGNTFFQCLVKLAEVEEDNSFIFGKLLEQNHTLIDITLTKYKNSIYLKSILHGEYCDIDYITAVLNKISDYGEKLIILIDAMKNQQL